MCRPLYGERDPNIDRQRNGSRGVLGAAPGHRMASRRTGLRPPRCYAWLCNDSLRDRLRGGNEIDNAAVVEAALRLEQAEIDDKSPQPLARRNRVPHPEAADRAAHRRPARLCQGDARARAGVRFWGRPAPGKRLSRVAAAIDSCWPARGRAAISRRGLPSRDGGAGSAFCRGDLRETSIRYTGRSLRCAENTCSRPTPDAKRLATARSRWRR